MSALVNFSLKFSLPTTDPYLAPWFLKVLFAVMISVEVAVGDHRNLLGLLSAVLGSNIVDNLVLDQVWL